VTCAAVTCAAVTCAAVTCAAVTCAAVTCAAVPTLLRGTGSDPVPGVTDSLLRLWGLRTTSSNREVKHGLGPGERVRSPTSWRTPPVAFAHGCHRRSV
jgi:hypothetical protein